MPGVVYDKMRVVITANGKGERMKGLSPFPKHELYYGDKKIIDHLLEVFPGAEVLTGFESNSRRETLERIKDYTDTLIVDCDIIPATTYQHLITNYKWFLFTFESDKEKYSSIITNSANDICEVNESKKISNTHCSGIYYVHSVKQLLREMTDDNSIASGMISAKALPEFSDIIKLGDPEDYYEALGIHNDPFTDHKIIFNKNSVIKLCKNGENEKRWYWMAKDIFNVPICYHADDEQIITERIFATANPTAEDFIRLIKIFKDTSYVDNEKPFMSYIDNLPAYGKPVYLPPHKGSFFHGDLSTHNVLKNSRLWLIDPNYKNIFGSWLTDAGKAVFSFIAYEKDYPSAKKIADAFCPEVWNFAVAEGLRVTKYKPEYLSIVNNIYDIYLKYGKHDSNSTIAGN